MGAKLLRNLPTVNELLEQTQLKALVDRISRSTVAARVRSVLDEIRIEVQHAATERTFPNVSELADRIARRISTDDRPLLRPVVNATGVLLPATLGSAPLPDAALEELVAVGRDYASAEIDLASGATVERGADLEPLLRELTGAEAALVVASESSALLASLAALAGGKHVAIARGDVGELDGGLLLTDLACAAGVRLVEVGTAHKTRVADFRTVLTDDAEVKVCLACPPAFIQVTGDAERPGIGELASVAHERGATVIERLALGSLLDATKFGLRGIPLVRAQLEAGADVVVFPGQRLVGGPTCGLIVGKRKSLDLIAQHAFTRASAPGQLTLAALAATLRQYHDADQAVRNIPLWHLLGTSTENLKNRAERLAPQLAQAPAVVSADARLDVVHLAGIPIAQHALDTWCVVLAPRTPEWTAERLAAALRTGHPAVLARVRDERVWLDLRSVLARQDQQLVAAVVGAGRPGA